MDISDNFRSQEFQQPARHGFQVEAYPEAWIDERLIPLCEALEAIRAAFRKPIRVLSGFRSAAYNAKIGGAKRSQHVQGRAADITIRGIPAQDLHDKILQLHKEKRIKISGLGLYIEANFVHVDVRPTKRLARWSGTRTVV